MSIFSKDIIEQDTDLQLFYDRVWKWVKQEFYPAYMHYDGDLHCVSSSFNRSFDNGNSRTLFEERGMYHPYFSAVLVAGPGIFSKILITILYSEDKRGFCEDTAKTFLRRTLNVSNPLLYKAYNS